MAASAKGSAPLTSPGYFVPFITVTALFLAFGFVTTLNMALVPHLRSIFNVGYKSAMLAESAFFLAYFVFSAPTSKLIEWIGYKKTMVVSLFIQVVGCLLFIPAARLVNFPLFLTASFVVGAGVTALQTSANPYTAILGPESSASVRLTLAQAFNSIGTTVAPVFAGAFILTDPTKFATPAAIANTVRAPYIAIAGALLLLGIAVAFSHLPHIDQPPSSHPAKEGGARASRSVWSYRHTVLGALGIFLYVGVEVGLASIAVNYFKSQGMSSLKTASDLASLYWFGALVGRLLGSWILTKVQVRQAAHDLRILRFGIAADEHVYFGQRGHMDPRAVRVLQLHHVPEYLYAGHRRAGPDDEQGVGADHDGNRGRSDNPGAAGRGGRSLWNPARVRPSAHLLSLHCLVRDVGIEAGENSFQLLAVSS